MSDLIDRQAAIEKVKKLCKGCYLSEHCGKCLAKCLVRKAVKILEKVSPAQPIALTADDIETIRIHLSAFKETLCNQGRWTEAEEYERLIQRLTGEGGQDGTEQ